MSRKSLRSSDPSRRDGTEGGKVLALHVTDLESIPSNPYGFLRTAWSHP